MRRSFNKKHNQRKNKVHQIIFLWREDWSVGEQSLLGVGWVFFQFFEQGNLLRDIVNWSGVDIRSVMSFPLDVRKTKY